MKTKIYFLLLFISSLVLQSQVNLSSSLTACYALNGTGTEPINNLTGTVTVATPTVDRFNNPNSAMYFDGTTNCKVRLPDNPLLKPANGLSFSIWVKPSAAGARHIIYTKNNLNSNFEAYQLCIYANAPVFRINKASSTGNSIVLSTTTVVPFTWYHIVGTYDNSMLNLYVNGVLEGSSPSTFTGFDYQIGKEVFLGNSNESFNFPFLGTMDNLRFYNRALNAAEVSALYTQDPSCINQSLPPVAAFNMNKNKICVGESIILSDQSANNPSSWFYSSSGGTFTNSTSSITAVTFNSSGVFTISLAASNSFGMSSNNPVQSVTVFPRPNVTAMVTPTIICKGQTASVSAAGAQTYLWTHNLSTSPGFTASPLVNTIYTVTGTDANSCVNSNTVLLRVVTDCVGLNENGMNKKFQIYPSITEQFVTITAQEKFDFTITDGLGRIIMEGFSEVEKKVIDLGALAVGVYYLTVWDLEKREVYKVIKE